MTETDLRERQVNRLLRGLRTAFYRALEPFDMAFRRMNRLSGYPPIALRRHVGHLGTLDGTGAEFAAYLKLIAGLKPSDSILDLGCGCGLLELGLLKSGWQGKLLGVDIHRPSIRWCQKHITPGVPSFTFEHADICNEAYWPHGRLTAQQYFDTLAGRKFDVVVAKSLFTHMLPGETEVYLKSMSGLLKPAGRIFMTFFLMNDEYRRQEKTGRPSIRFVRQPADAAYAVKRTDAPTASVAYEEGHIMKLMASAGLHRQAVHYGFWAGNEGGLSYQDILLATGGAGSADVH